uniref:Uncharacterized protein n=1 Tax=Romanomermis culicivorax TaxID=13658 RepID=A0A915I7D8_ROMCU
MMCFNNYFLLIEVASKPSVWQYCNNWICCNNCSNMTHNVFALVLTKHQMSTINGEEFKCFDCREMCARKESNLKDQLATLKTCRAQNSAEADKLNRKLCESSLSETDSGSEDEFNEVKQLYSFTIVGDQELNEEVPDLPLPLSGGADRALQQHGNGYYQKISKLLCHDKLANKKWQSNDNRWKCIDMKIAQMIAPDDLPFSHVEDVGFMELMMELWRG